MRALRFVINCRVHVVLIGMCVMSCPLCTGGWAVHLHVMHVELINLNICFFFTGEYVWTHLPQTPKGLLWPVKVLEADKSTCRVFCKCDNAV